MQWEELLAEEKRVERDRFSQRHTDDGLDENLAGGTWIAADALDGLGANETDADGRRDATERTLDGTCDFSDDLDHDVWMLLLGVPPSALFWHGPDGRVSRISARRPFWWRARARHGTRRRDCK